LSKPPETGNAMTQGPADCGRPHRVIAVIGCDGSGKSTLSRWLSDELAQHGDGDSQFIYFGTGDGPGSRLIRVLNWLKKRSRFGQKPSATDKVDGGQAVAGAAVSVDGVAGKVPTTTGNTNKAPTVLRLLWAAAALSDRRAKMRELDRAVGGGMTVVTDRYPQAEFWGVHDGPRLGYLLEAESSRWLQAIARREQSAYFNLVQRKPDLVILLDVSVELAHSRRPEEPVDELRRRIHVARSLRLQGAHRVVLDASEPLDVVQRKALQAALNHRPSGPASAQVERERTNHAG